MSCQVLLDGSQYSYSPGSRITGRVECQFKDGTKVRSVKIRLKCKELVHWKNGKTHYERNNVLLQEERDLLVLEIPTEYKGTQTFPFTFVLPFEIPSSFNAEYGNVLYSLKSSVDIPMWKDPTHTLQFLVDAPLIFNASSPLYPQRTIHTKEKSVYFCCSNRGNIAMEVELPSTAFVSGETVNFRVGVQNLTLSNVDYLKGILKQTVVFGTPSSSRPNWCNQAQRLMKNEILSFEENGLGAHSEFNYNLSFKIPKTLLIPNFTGCEYFRVRNCLKIYCRLLSGFSNLIVKVPDITIGHARCDVNTLEHPETVIYSSDLQSYLIMRSS